jgi:hypothetical protein
MAGSSIDSRTCGKTTTKIVLKYEKWGSQNLKWGSQNFYIEKGRKWMKNERKWMKNGRKMYENLWKWGNTIKKNTQKHRFPSKTPIFASKYPFSYQNTSKHLISYVKALKNTPKHPKTPQKHLKNT